MSGLGTSPGSLAQSHRRTFPTDLMSWIQVTTLSSSLHLLWRTMIIRAEILLNHLGEPMGSPMGRNTFTEITPGQPACVAGEYTCAGEERLYRKTNQHNKQGPTQKVLILFPKQQSGIYEWEHAGREKHKDPGTSRLTSWLYRPHSARRSSPVCIRICRWSPRHGCAGGRGAGASWHSG